MLRFASSAFKYHRNWSNRVTHHSTHQNRIVRELSANQTPMNLWSNTDICRSQVELQQQTFHFVPNPSNAFNSLRTVWTLPFQLSWAEGNQAAISLGHNKHLVSLAEQIKRRFGWGNKTVLFCFVLTVWNVKILRRISSPFFPLPDRAWNHSAVFPPLHNNLPL